MKNRGFTLLELLIVISIIAILAAIAYPVTTSVMRHVKNVNAQADMSSIQTAINGYRLEYGRFPLADHGNDVNDLAITREFMRCLMGYHDGDTFPAIPNPRQISFIDPRFTDTPRGGYYSANGGFYDPWGNCYVISIDGNYDNQLADPDTGALIRKDLLVYSLGSDAAPSGGNLHPGTIYTEGLDNRAQRSWK